jgi:hypothetical protein
MSQAVKLSKLQWLKLREKLIQDYPRSVILLRWKMLEVLGFTDREHEEWVDYTDDPMDMGWSTKARQTTVHLDFYNEPKRTMFLLKYSEYLQK